MRKCAYSIAPNSIESNRKSTRESTYTLWSEIRILDQTGMIGGDAKWQTHRTDWLSSSSRVGSVKPRGMNSPGIEHSLQNAYHMKLLKRAKLVQEFS